MVWHSVSWVPQTCGRSMHLVAVESLVAGLAEEAVVLVHHALSVGCMHCTWYGPDKATACKGLKFLFFLFQEIEAPAAARECGSRGAAIGCLALA